MPHRNWCHWRNYVRGHHERLEDFTMDQCVFISPRMARFYSSPYYLPYFQVHAALRRHIWESMHQRKVPAGATMCHQCLQYADDSRGLCVNPKHITIGTKDDNRIQARNEELIRRQRGYWTASEHKPLDAIPTEVTYTHVFPTPLDPHQLWLYDANHIETLSTDECAAYTYCDAHYRQIVHTPMCTTDADLLRHADLLVHGLKSNNDDIVKTESNFFHNIHVKTPCAQRCAAHRTRKRKNCSSS